MPVRAEVFQDHAAFLARHANRLSAHLAGGLGQQDASVAHLQSLLLARLFELASYCWWIASSEGRIRDRKPLFLLAQLVEGASKACGRAKALGGPAWDERLEEACLAVSQTGELLSKIEADLKASSTDNT